MISVDLHKWPDGKWRFAHPEVFLETRSYNVPKEFSPQPEDEVFIGPSGARFVPDMNAAGDMYLRETGGKGSRGLYCFDIKRA